MRTVGRIFRRNLCDLFETLRIRYDQLTKENCPNCISAWTGGNSDPYSRDFCVVCSDPNTGRIRGWVWRWVWFHSKVVTQRNFAKFLHQMGGIGD